MIITLAQPCLAFISRRIQGTSHLNLTMQSLSLSPKPQDEAFDHSDVDSAKVSNILNIQFLYYFSRYESKIVCSEEQPFVSPTV